MELTLRDKNNVMYARFTGTVAHNYLSRMVCGDALKSVSPARSDVKQSFVATDDFKLVVGDSIAVYLWEGTRVIVK